MKAYLCFIPAFCLVLFSLTGCSSSGKTSNYYNSNKDTMTFNGGYENVIQLAAKAVKAQGLGIDKAYAVNMNKYVIMARLNNSYITSSPYSGNSDIPQESEAKVVISYIGNSKTSVYVKVPKQDAPGIRNAYRKDLKGQIFHYISRRLQ